MKETKRKTWETVNTTRTQVKQIRKTSIRPTRKVITK